MIPVNHFKAFKLTIIIFHYFTNFHKFDKFHLYGSNPIGTSIFHLFYFYFVALQGSNTHITITLVVLYIYPTFQLYLWSQISIEIIHISQSGLLFPPRSGFLCFHSHLLNTITFIFHNNCLFSQILSFCNSSHFYCFISIIPNILWPCLLLFILWFIMGYLLYRTSISLQ